MPARPLDGKIALVTGGTRGIGWGVAQALAASGATIVLTGTDGATAERAALLEAQHGVPAVGWISDVAKADAVAALYREIFTTFRRLDILVNNAGILADGLAGMVEDARIERALAVNVAGSLRNLHAAARLMRRGGGGVIVNLSSIMASQGVTGQTVYAATKAAVIGMTRAAAVELGPHNIRVNAVAPGMIETDMLAGLDEPTRAARLAATPLGRFGTPADVADMVLFLVSDSARFVTGQVIGVDGGLHL